jgi:predicted Zn-dependent protease
MSILEKIVGRLKQIAAGISEKVEEVREKFEERRAERLAARLDEMAADTPYKNWRTSVQDLAYLIGEDGSYDGRKALWEALRFTQAYKGSVGQNEELRTRLMDDVAHELGYRLI